MDKRYLFCRKETSGNTDLDLASMLLSDIQNFCVCIIDEKPIGFGCAVLEEKECFINWLYIKEDYRRDGMGTAVVKFLLNRAEISGAQNAFLITDCMQFAVKNGFTKLDNTSMAENKYIQNYGYPISGCIYHVFLHNYFKTCCSARE
ncbi:MAG: GNAT family N-acetyltransferase [Rhizobium sp.]|nr:GNAT family N-acetyltransferase [Rhizobium sp.]